MAKKLLSALPALLTAACALVGLIAMWQGGEARSATVFVDMSPPAATVEAIDVAPGALLYYNAPAATQVGDAILVGLIDNTGAVRIVHVDRTDERSVLVHQYDSPDDHGAPAIWAIDGKIILATARHSSELFLYEIDAENAVSLRCTWAGKYSYPRFIEEDGGLRLYVRIEDGRAGHLGYTEISDECVEPAISYRAPEGKWIYATAGGKARWSFWDRKTNRHGGLWADGIAQKRPSADYPEMLAWSHFGTGMTAISFFRDAFECCGRGEVEAIIQERGQTIYSTVTDAPYYPTGIVISDDGQEFLTPLHSQITRRDLSDFSPLPSCSTAGHNSAGQYVHGGDGSYVYLNWSGNYNPNDFGNTRVLLCPSVFAMAASLPHLALPE